MNNFSHFPHWVHPEDGTMSYMRFPSPIRHMEYDKATQTVLVVTDDGVYRVMGSGEVPA